MPKPHIIILGAGFGGVYVAKKLVRMVKKGKIFLTVVNRTNYFLFTPLLHEVATGSLSPRSVAEPLREVFAGKGVHIIQGSVESVDAEGKKVTIVNDPGLPGRAEAPANDKMRLTIDYDRLLVSTGAETNYYGIPGADKFTYPLKSLMDAVNIRSRIIDVFEQAILEEDKEKRERLLSFAVVGGGPTGVETAAELAEFIEGMIRRYYSDTNCPPGKSGEPWRAGRCGKEEPKIYLINTGNELLEMFSPRLRVTAEKRLRKTGVILRLNTMVTEVTKKGLKLKPFQPTAPAGEGGHDTSEEPKELETATVIWAAGVKPAPPIFLGKSPALSGGRLIVDEYFRVQGHKDIFAMGDAAAYVDVHKFMEDSKNTKPVPMLAQAAVAESKTVYANIRASIQGKPLSRFHWHPLGAMVSVGSWFAVGEILSMNIAGRLAWWLWRTVYLFKFASWKKRLRIALDWTLELFNPRDITKLT